MKEAIVTNSVYAWMLAARPKTLGAMCCPIMVGTALAMTEGAFHASRFVFTFLSSVFLQILANLINDYGDFIKGSDSHDRLGPPRAMQMGFITKDAMIRGIVMTALTAIFCGIPLVMVGGFPILVLGFLGMALCAWYTLGKKPLAYLGYVEFIIFIVFGPGAVLGSYYIETLSFSNEALMASITPGILSTALILTNNLRDIVQDKKNHKYTTAVRIGEGWARLFIVLLIMSSCISPLILFFMFSYHPVVLVSLFSLLLPVRYIQMILFEPISSDFNHMLGGIGKTLYLFGIVFSFGIIYGAP